MRAKRRNMRIGNPLAPLAGTREQEQYFPGSQECPSAEARAMLAIALASLQVPTCHASGGKHLGDIWNATGARQGSLLSAMLTL